jgi:hypothetical protein
MEWLYHGIFLVSLLRFFMSTLFGINPVVDSRLRSRIRHRHSMVSENFRFIRRFSDRLYLLVRQCRPSARRKIRRSASGVATLVVEHRRGTTAANGRNDVLAHGSVRQ